MYAVTNRIKVQKGRGAEMEEVFGKRGGVEKEPGFKSFELWRLDADEDHEEYLVVTRWDSKEDFKNWTQSDSFKQAHAGPPPVYILGPGQLANFEVKISSDKG